MVNPVRNIICTWVFYIELLVYRVCPHNFIPRLIPYRSYAPLQSITYVSSTRLKTHDWDPRFFYSKSRLTVPGLYPHKIPTNISPTWACLSFIIYHYGNRNIIIVGHVYVHYIHHDIHHNSYPHVPWSKHGFDGHNGGILIGIAFISHIFLFYPSISIFYKYIPLNP